MAFVFLFLLEGQYIAWTLRSIEESPIETLDLESISDYLLLKISEFPFGNLQNMPLSHCSFSFAAFSVFLEFYPHIVTLHMQIWNRISRIGERKGSRMSEHPKISLDPATYMSLTRIRSTATILRTPLSTAEIFSVL